MSNPKAVMTTNLGRIEIELFADKAPQTVKNFAALAAEGYYDGVKFHRIIDEFMIQCGDPKSKDDKRKAEWGTGGPGYSIIDEFACVDGTTSNALPTMGRLVHRFTGPGMLAMANTGRPRTGGSQFFITLAPTSHLDGRHTIFGKVAAGLDVVKKIGKVRIDRHDRPAEPIVIQSLKLEGDVPAVKLQKF